MDFSDDINLSYTHFERYLRAFPKVERIRNWIVYNTYITTFMSKFGSFVYKLKIFFFR